MKSAETLKRSLGGPAGLGLFALAYLALSFSPLHYWDEYFYLLSLRDHAPSTLFELEPELGGLFPNGFFSAKAGFVFLLHALVGVLGDGHNALAVVQLSFALMMAGMIFGGYRMLQNLHGAAPARGAAVVLAVLPLTLYLGYKTLSEIPSLLFTTFGCWQFLASFETRDRWTIVRRLALAAPLLGAGLFCRFPGLLMFAALVPALFLFGDKRFPRPQVLIRAAVVGTAALVLAMLAWALLAWAPPQRFAALVTNLTGRSEDWTLKVYAVVISLQLFTPFLLWALLPRWERGTRMAVVWLAGSTLPFVLLSDYVEPRFFYMGIIPLAWLVHAGYRRFLASVRLPPDGPLAWSLFIVLVLGNRFLLAPLMPHEIDQAQYRTLMDRQLPRATYLVPWLSDYCYLSFVYPQRDVRFVMSWAKNEDPKFYRGTAFRRWVGEGKHAGDLGALRDAPRPWYYVGWDYNPILGRIRERMRWLGFGTAEPLRYSQHQKNHLALSWVWSTPALTLREIDRSDHYRVFDVGPTR